MRRLAVFLVAALLVWVRPSAAATVGILDTPSRAPAITEARFRLEGELLAVGLELENARRPASLNADPSGTLTRLATERRLEAIVDVVGETTLIAVEVWLFDREARELHLTRVVPEPQAESASANLAIRATEVIRSNLLERGLALRPKTAKAPADEAPPREPSADVAASPHDPERARWGLQGGVAALSSFDGSGVSVAPLLRLDWALTPRWWAHLSASGFGTQPTLTSANGTAQLSQAYALVGLQACHYCSASMFPFAGLALGALHTAVDGRASAPLRAHATSQVSLLFEASLGVSARLSERFSLSLASHLQLAEPYVAVHFAEQVVATLGRPNLSASLTLGAWL